MKEIKQIDFTCPNCEKEYIVLTPIEEIFCGKGVCCSCCKKQGLQSDECKMFQLELKRESNGTFLSRDDIKGLLMEKAVSDALTSLKIPHTHNPFNNTYPCYQNKRPDIIIEKLNLAIECKNLNQIQIEQSLSNAWLDENIISRPYFKNYKRKIAFFSYKPRQSSIKYLNTHGWRIYSLGTQILTVKQMRKSMGKMKQRFYWLKVHFPSQL
ncbi:MAG: hypothetical protein NWE94_08805 [Candidatus Bathyarchaeota archaeon]|nr:hypothetical protein [Candidatus Bathyarchaeota archaeon]